MVRHHVALATIVERLDAIAGLNPAQAQFVLAYLAYAAPGTVDLALAAITRVPWLHHVVSYTPPSPSGSDPGE